MSSATEGFRRPGQTGQPVPRAQGGTLPAQDPQIEPGNEEDLISWDSLAARRVRREPLPARLR